MLKEKAYGSKKIPKSDDEKTSYSKLMIDETSWQLSRYEKQVVYRQ
jgi:hypothetical protein